MYLRTFNLFARLHPLNFLSCLNHRRQTMPVNVCFCIFVTMVEVIRMSYWNRQLVAVCRLSRLIEI